MNSSGTNKRRTVLKTIGGIAVASGIAGQVSASSTITVPTDYDTINDAVDAAAPGDTVVVKDGKYREQVIVRKDLTVRGEGNPTLLPPSGNLGVGDIAVIQPIFGARGYGNDVTFEGFTVDGEEASDKGGFYSCVGYYLADGTIRDVELTGADYGAYISQNRGGTPRTDLGQEVNVFDSHFEDLGLSRGVNQQLVFNEPGTTGKVQDCTFVGDKGERAFLYGLSPGYSASIKAQGNSFENFYGGSFQIALYGFNTPDCTVQKNDFQACQFPIYVAATDRVSRTSADKFKIVKNSIDGSDVPDDLAFDSFGTTLFAEDLEEDDGAVQTVNNAKIVNNDYSDLDVGVSLNATGEGVVNNTKIIRNKFENVDTAIENNGGEQTKQEANRI